MKCGTKEPREQVTLKTLPGDDVRQIMWGFSDRYDLQMAVQAARSVARGPVARLVAKGARNSHEWTDEKASLLKAYDESGITGIFLDPEYGGFVEGPKNMAMALSAFELSWVDGGAATCSMATDLALGPIHEKGTPEQKATYFKRCSPAQQGANGKIWRGAFALTEPLPFVGVDTGVLCGKIRVAEWKDGKEPLLQVEKRGRFITNMDFANFVTAAVDSDDPKIKGSCMVIVEETDPGTFDRGAPTLKLVHQLSSTRDPIINVKVPASRIIGGYTIKDGVIVPNYSHGEIIEAVFLRTRVSPGLMTAAKLLSAVEPVMRYQRQRFRGGNASSAGTPRYELGLQQKEDAVHRLVDIWATGEAAAALGFASASLLDQFEPVEKEKNEIFRKQGISGPRAQMKALGDAQKKALEYLNILAHPEEERDQKRLQELERDTLTRFVLFSSLINVLVPAGKLWATGHGTNIMREAVSLMGGYGITEDCPGFLAHKWMDAQLEATYEGPESVQRRQLSVTMMDEVFLAQFRNWIVQLRRIANDHPETGACNLASACEMWLLTANHLQNAKDANGKPLYHQKRQGVTFPMADALSWLVATRCQLMSVLELKEKGQANPSLTDGLQGFVNFFSDLCHVHTARASGEVGRICAELAFGYSHHPTWACPEEKNCFSGDYVDEVESLIPGFASGSREMKNVLEVDGSHPYKPGPCVCLSDMEPFLRMRRKLDGCLSGSRLAKDRAAEALTQVMIPEALDYPL